MRVKNFALAALLAAGMSYGEEPFSATFDLTSGNAFTANGITWVDGPVTMPSLSLNYAKGINSVTATLWSVVNLNEVRGYDNPQPEKGNITEFDVILDYTYTGLKMINLSAGFIHYNFIQLEDDYSYTNDLYLSGSFNTLLNPKLDILFDLDEGQDSYHGGFHIDLGISHGVPINDKLSLESFASLGWADKDYYRAYFSSGDQNESSYGIKDYKVGMSMPMKVHEYLSISPTITYNALGNSKGVLGQSFESLRTAGYGGSADKLVFSFSLTASM